MLMQYMQAPTPMGYHEIKRAGIELVKHLASHEGMTYQKAWDTIDTLRQIADKAEKILNWNAGVEKSNDPITWVIDPE